MQIENILKIILVLFGVLVFYIVSINIYNSCYLPEKIVEKHNIDLIPSNNDTTIKITKDNKINAVKKIITIDSNESVEKEFVVKYSRPEVKPDCNVCKESLDSTFPFLCLSLLCFVLAFLLPRITSITLPGGGSLTIEAIQQELNNVKEVVNGDQESKVVNKIIKEEPSFGTLEYKNKVKQIYNNDPQKGKWGGLSEKSGRKISAMVGSLDVSGNYFRVILRVESTNVLKPLKGIVVFHLHDSFENKNPKILVENGIAELSLLAWAAFTVGAETDNGNVKLELDLSENLNFPKEFREM
ncbi:MAG: pYEATS domain-containing protein [Saprospiraceae bacterium]